MKLFDGLKLVFLTDFHIEALPTKGGWEPATAPCLDTALNFCEDFKPDITILGGDFMNFDMISYHTKDNLLLREGRRLKHDFEYANQILDRIDKFTKGDKVFMVGNHDAWLQQWIGMNPSVEGLISLDYNLNLAKRDYEMVQENKVYRVGHARFVHGWYYNIHHSKKTVTEMGDNIFYGHTHSVQAYCKPNPDRIPIIGYSVGCLCDLNPHYRKNRPNQWVNGFGIFYFSENRQFTFYNPVIIKNVFWWGGKLYSPNGKKQ